MKYYRVLVLYALRIISPSGLSQPVAEDIVQEAFGNILEHGFDFDTELSARSYIYTSVRHLSIDTVRHQGIVNSYEPSETSETEVQEIDNKDMEREEVLRRVLVMIDNMPPRQREVFLHIMEGKKAREIAEMMNISENTVKMQKKRGINSLRQKLSPEAFSVFLAIL